MVSIKQLLEEELIEAATCDRTADVIRLLDLGVDVDATKTMHGNLCEWTPLMWASSKGNMECVELLLKRGALVNKQTKDGQTPLMAALLCGHVGCLKTLLEGGAEANLPNKDGQTPLMAALLCGHVGCVKTLLEGGAEANLPNKNGWTPLSWTLLLTSSAEFVKILLLLDGWTLPSWAVQHGNSAECVKALLEGGAQANLSDMHGMTPLMQAIFSGSTECVRALLQGGAQANLQDERGVPPLTQAISSGSTDCVRALLQGGAQANLQDEHGATPLIQAILSGSTECVRALLEGGAQANLQDKHGMTPLIQAVLSDSTEYVIALLQGGAQANLQDKNGMTPLIQAILSGSVECVGALLEGGAQANLQTYENGTTPLLWAISTGATMQCVKLLLEKGAQVNLSNKQGVTPLVLAASKGHNDCVKLFVEGDAQVNLQDQSGETALIQAAACGSIDCVKTLLENGAQINMQNQLGETALIRAASCGSIGCVKTLLENGAKVDIKNHQDGNTALHLATINGHIESVRALLCCHGIQQNMENLLGHTAFSYATYNVLTVFKEIETLHNMSLKYPVHSYGKVVLCGNSGSGKSTLTQAIINISKPATERVIKRIFGRQHQVEPLTAGIIPHQVDSPYSNMVIYDLAGHQQYFSSHSACLEAISLKSPAIFLLLQDVTKDFVAITRELYYWATMIDGVCHKCPQKSSVIVVGTHADLLTPEQLSKKLTHLQSVATLAIEHHHFTVLTLNVTDAFSVEMRQFGNLLHEINKNIVKICPSIPISCHILYAFLKEKIIVNLETITVCDLLLHLSNEKNPIIVPTLVNVFPLLWNLSDKGLIMFIPSENPINSWVIINKESILKKINGKLFADPSLKEYSIVSSNTGVISTAMLHQIFPEYNIEMITLVMIQFELCKVVDLSHIDTNMEPLLSSSSPSPLLFCPALVSVSRPTSAHVPSNVFTFSIAVKSLFQFFSTRLLHVLLLRLAFRLCLPTVHDTTHSSNFNRRCDIWSRGIQWLSETGVTAIVEMSDNFQSITLAVSCPNKRDPDYLQLFHAILTITKLACEEFCPCLEVIEMTTCPPEASSDHCNTVVELPLLKNALVARKERVVDVKGNKYVVLSEWMKIEPCLPSLIGVNSEALPMAQTVQVPTASNSGNSPSLMELTNDVVSKIPAKWRAVGVQLGLSSDTLDSVQRDNGWKPHASQDSFERVFSIWKQQGPSPCTWETIVDALRTPSVGEVALAEEICANHLSTSRS